MIGSQYRSSLVLGPDISRDQVKFRLGSLMIDFGDGDAIHFDGFDSDDPWSTPVLEAIQFADGEVMTYEDVLEQGFDIDGTEGDDLIEGTAVTDRIDGKGGNDAIRAKGGDDSILGGEGDDAIDAGAGDDLIDAGAGLPHVRDPRGLRLSRPLGAAGDRGRRPFPDHTASGPEPLVVRCRPPCLRRRVR